MWEPTHECTRCGMRYYGRYFAFQCCASGGAARAETHGDFPSRDTADTRRKSIKQDIDGLRKLHPEDAVEVLRDVEQHAGEHLRQQVEQNESHGVPERDAEPGEPVGER